MVSGALVWAPPWPGQGPQVWAGAPGCTPGLLGQGLLLPCSVPYADRSFFIQVSKSVLPFSQDIRFLPVMQAGEARWANHLG